MAHPRDGESGSSQYLISQSLSIWNLKIFTCISIALISYRKDQGVGVAMLIVKVIKTVFHLNEVCFTYLLRYHE